MSPSLRSGISGVQTNATTSRFERLLKKLEKQVPGGLSPLGMSRIECVGRGPEGQLYPKPEFFSSILNPLPRFFEYRALSPL
jgi:hypothetical protein